MQRAIRLGVIALVAVAAVLVGISVLYALDARGHRDRVLRRVQVAGQDVGGMRRAELVAAVAELEKTFTGAKVKVTAGSDTFTTTTDDLGVRVDRDATVAAAMAVGRGGSVADRVGGWFTGFFNSRKAPIRVDVQPGKAYADIAAKDKDRTPAVEPSLKVEDGTIVAVAGTPGKGIDAADVIAAVPGAAADGLPIEVRVPRGTVQPRFTLAEARVLAERAMETVDESVAVTAGGDRANVSVARLRGWVSTEATDEGLILALDHVRTLEGLPELLPNAGKEPTETRFTVGGGGVNIVAGTPGTACCSDTAVELIEAALFRPTGGGDDDEPIDLPLKEVPPKRTVEEARELGIEELVGAFTTKHPAGQPRVTNIHRIADLIRGQVIEPGATFSVNGFVGPRTVEKGFVVDKVIEEGRFAESVGGGISQFATTFFNAAFFAGLDLSEYQTHSIYISRYPYGREATLSFPKPDLRITNKTPYGVLIWPSYTSTSITVELYSTKLYEVTQTNQTKEPRGQSCTRVRTERTIKTLSDGSVKKDYVNAVYRGAEGLNCDQPLSASTTTTRPGASTTTTTTAPASPPSSSP